MLKKPILLLVLLATSVFISGCIFGNGADTPEGIPETDLPAGFTYMGAHEAPVNIGGSLINATEGVYRNSNGEDVYIQLIKNDKPDALIDQYRLQYKDANYNPFEEVSINGHKATKVTDYTTINGKQKAHYTIIWAADKLFVIVGSSTEPQSVMSLASATGY